MKYIYIILCYCGEETHKLTRFNFRVFSIFDDDFSPTFIVKQQQEVFQTGSSVKISSDCVFVKFFMLMVENKETVCLLTRRETLSCVSLCVCVCVCVSPSFTP